MTDFTENAICYDNTRLSEYKRCPRAFFIRHVLGWNTEGTGDALVFGQSWHEGMDIIWKCGQMLGRGELTQLDVVDMAHQNFMKTWIENGFPETMDFGGYDRFGARTPGTAKEMMWSYIDERRSMLCDAEILGIEQPFAVPLPGVQNTWYVGRLDKAVHYNGQTLILEHKTTTAYAREGGFRSDYIDSWFASSQVKGYQFGGGLYYPDLSAVWVDAALVHNKVHDEFRFIPVAHGPHLLTEWLGNTTTWVERVTESRRQERAGVLLSKCFPKNEDNCFGKFGKCPFLDICMTNDDPRKLGGPPGGFEVNVWEPFDLLGLDKLVKKGQDNESD